MSSTQYLTDTTTRHAVFLQRYAGGRSKEALILLNRIKRDIIIRLAQEPTIFQRNRLEAVLKDVEAIMVEGFNGIALKVNQDVSELALAEAKHSTAVFNKASSANFTLPADDQLISAVATQVMAVQSGVAVTIEEALSQFSKKKQAEIANIIADGVTLGDTSPVISKKVSMTIDTLNRRQVDTLVRTVTNHASSVSRQQVYNANSDLMEGYQWVSTLDSRTTLICASRDKKIYQAPYGPMTPAHWGCRSTTIPKLKPQFDLGASVHGERPSRGAKGFKQESAAVTYSGWLREQPIEFVNEALGPKRAALFKYHNVPLREMIDSSGKRKTLDNFYDPTGKVYTLKELIETDPITMIK